MQVELPVVFNGVLQQCGQREKVRASEDGEKQDAVIANRLDLVDQVAEWIFAQRLCRCGGANARQRVRHRDAG